MTPYLKWLRVSTQHSTPFKLRYINTYSIWVGRKVQQPRCIASISGEEISLDISLTDSLNATNNIMNLIAITTSTPPAQPTEMGVENINIQVSPKCSGVRLGEKNLRRQCNSHLFLGNRLLGSESRPHRVQQFYRY